MSQNTNSQLSKIVLPEKGNGNIELVDILDVHAIQSLMDSFYKLVHIPMAMIDLKGSVLVGVGWQDICTRFHRAHPDTCRFCIDSDTQLSAGVSPGEFKLYKCMNNMWDVATPIVVGGKHVGNLFAGQFFFDNEPLDYEFFRAQARKYGFDEEEYIADLENVPRLSRESVNAGMSFFIELADMISKLSYSNIRLAQSLSEREALMETLQRHREDLNRAQAVAQTGSWRLDTRRNELLWSDQTYRMFGVPLGTPLTYELFLDKIHPDDREYVDKKWTAAMQGAPYDIEHRIVVNGKVEWVRERAELEFDEHGVLTGGFGTVQDITERKKVEQEQKELLKREQNIARMLQQALVPPFVPEEINGYKFAVKYKPALREAEIGGDFYDVFDLGDGCVCVLIGDVAGKGLRAAMRVAAARYAIRSYAFIEKSPSRILTLANDTLCCSSDEEHDMLTAFLGIINTRLNTIVFANAGQEPPLLIIPDDSVEELVTSGPPLGVLQGVDYTEDTHKIEPGSKIVMITNGITEARVSSVDLFGKERVIDYVRDSAGSPPQIVVDGLLSTATAYAGGELQDDAAIVMIERFR